MMIVSFLRPLIDSQSQTSRHAPVFIFHSSGALQFPRALRGRFAPTQSSPRHGPAAVHRAWLELPVSRCSALLMKRVIAKVAQVATACQSSEARSKSATGRSTRRARRRRRVLQLVPRDESGSSVWHPSLAFPPHPSDQPTTRPLEPFFKLSRSRQAWRTLQALIGFWSLRAAPRPVRVCRSPLRASGGISGVGRRTV